MIPSPGLAAQVACLLEATARKPGNVHRLADFPGDAHYLDFLLAAAAIARPIEEARARGVGATVLAAVEATRGVVSTNANLGIILLIAPLACVPEGVSLRDGVVEVLRRTTLQDATDVYRAIRLANPGGLGEVPEQDVAAEPTVTLLDAMTIAAGRDAIAREYAEGFRGIFDMGLPALKKGLGKSENLEGAIVLAFLEILSTRPDTLIARKRGWSVAEEASRRAGEAIATGDHASLDAWLRGDEHARNPGATADLIAATLFVALREGTIPLPLPDHVWSSLSGGLCPPSSIPGRWA